MSDFTEANKTTHRYFQLPLIKKDGQINYENVPYEMLVQSDYYSKITFNY